MYWDNAYDVLYRPFGERRPTAKKEHTCCEHDTPKIVVGERYLYISGIWRRPDDYTYVEGFKQCLGCEEDWDTILRIFHEDGQDEACIVYGRLSDAVWDALEWGLIEGTHPLVRKWHPEEYKTALIESGESEEKVIWDYVTELAVGSGLQPTLPLQLE